ncbi:MULTISPECIES: DMT family transporter [Actinoalloteichus]|uniref:Cation/cationic drug transporter n=1 Tax=Actinoalloteichus fjordicus TaxID=1612552 RepID=A0AAC9LDK7_9PSEU|nr:MULTISPECIES: multidrug efflux SMR transporter [Actinoalloteichus]APU14880.1 cation/cationic drug transporter [Actinoalloteichus fjordicus]APU20849.1 cation/cationic drug transporter [Actinoalloteichus sp. GBA129-24]
MGYLLLSFAIVTEVTATISLRLSEGFTRLIPSIITVVGYATAFFLLSRTLIHGVPLGIAYGIWAGAGVALVAVIGAVFLGDGMTWVQSLGIVAIIGGVLALELGAAH